MQIVSTKSSDGFHFKGLLSEAKDSKKIIIHIHGMAGSILFNEYYPFMHTHYPDSGYSFLAGQHRGSGTVTAFTRNSGSGICGSAFEKFEDCVYDIQAWIDFAKSKGYEEIWLQAHSLGPSKIAYYISQTKNHGISGLIFISPSEMVGLVHDEEVGQKDYNLMYPEAKKLQKEGKGNVLLSHTLWGENLLSADTFLNLFDEGTHAAIFNFANESLGWDVVNSIDIPVIAFTGTKDDGIEPVAVPEKAMKMLEKELKNSPGVKTVVYEGADHSFNGFGEKIVKDVVDFVKKLK